MSGTVDRTAGAIGFGVIWIKPYGLREVGDRLIVLTFDRTYDSAAAVQVGLVRLQADGFRIIGNGAIAFNPRVI